MSELANLSPIFWWFHGNQSSQSRLTLATLSQWALRTHISHIGERCIRLCNNGIFYHLIVLYSSPKKSYQCLKRRISKIAISNFFWTFTQNFIRVNSSTFMVYTLHSWNRSRFKFYSLKVLKRIKNSFQIYKNTKSFERAIR